MKETQKIIYVMQAHLAGLPIEFKKLESNAAWMITEEPLWNWMIFTYRVLEPKTIWINTYKSNTTNVFNTQKEAKDNAQFVENCTQTKILICASKYTLVEED